MVVFGCFFRPGAPAYCDDQKGGCQRDCSNGGCRVFRRLSLAAGDILTAIMRFAKPCGR
jgi:hypothetical protein